MTSITPVGICTDTERVVDLRQRVRNAMEHPPQAWNCPEQIDAQYLSEPLAVRKARAIALKLSLMPADLWDGQLLAGSITLENPCLHMEWGFPDYLTEEERRESKQLGVGIRSVFGHIVPDYPKLLHKGLGGILEDVRLLRKTEDNAFLESVVIACEAVIAFADRLAGHCDDEAREEADLQRAEELKQMAANLRQVPAGPAQNFWQALQSVWLLHMIFHATMNGNAAGRLDQYVWPYLAADLESGLLEMQKAVELVDCFFLKFNERAKTTEEQQPEARDPEVLDFSRQTRHNTSSQLGTRRDGLDATNHWLQNIIIGGVTPKGEDGTNLLTFLLLSSYGRNRMTNPLLTVRVHRESPEELLQEVCEVLKEGGGMPAVFNDEALIPALENMGFPTQDARDYSNDGCWEVIIPGRTDFRFQRLSLMLCLEWALNRGRSRLNGNQHGPDTGDPRSFTCFEDIWQAFLVQLDAMVERVVARVMETIDNRHVIAPVPLLSALIEGAIESRRDMTAGGAKYRTFGMLAESASHAIDSFSAIKTVLFEEKRVSMVELCDALDVNFEGKETLRRKLLSAPHYGNDDPRSDEIGRQVMTAFADTVEKHAAVHRASMQFPCGVATFSWYIGIGEGLGPSPDGRLSGEPVASNFSPSLGRDLEGISGAILSYCGMQPDKLAAGGPLDLRLARRLVEGEDGTDRMVALLRSFTDLGGSMLTLTVADTEELRAAQREPEKYRSLRVRMGGWCAYFTMLSREQQDHHIRRQEAGR